MRAIPAAEEAADRRAEAAHKAATEAAIQAAIDAIPDSEFDDRAEIIEARNQASVASAELKHARAQRKKVDANPAPGRIAALQVELAGRETALRACEFAAVASGSADDLKACVVERAALRDLADELESLQSGWSQVLAAVPCAIDDESLAALETRAANAEQRIRDELDRLKRARADGTEARVRRRQEMAAMARGSVANPMEQLGNASRAREIAARREGVQFAATVEVGATGAG